MCICLLSSKKAERVNEPIDFYCFGLIWLLMRYRAEITIQLKQGMLDPEGETIQRALIHLGYAVTSAHAAKQLLIELEADDADDAMNTLDEMCRRMLANPVIHNYSIELQ